ILSGMLLPLDDGPAWLRVVAQFNPLTHVVNAESDLFAGHIATSSVAFGFLVAIITAALGFVFGLRALRSSTSCLTNLRKDPDHAHSRHRSHRPGRPSTASTGYT